MADCENCPLAPVFEQFQVEYNESKKRGSDARKEIYARLRDLETERGRNEERYRNIENTLSELKRQQAEILDQIKELHEKPAKRWDSAIASAVSAIIGGLMGIFIGNIFGGS